MGHTIRSVVTATNAGGSEVATSAATAVVTPPSNGPLSGLHVSGNELLDGSGGVVRLHGVNRSGSEYACVQGWGIFDGPSDAASVAAMAAWHIDVVRVPLNEDCWLGINGVPAAYAGSNYVNAIVGYVNLLHSYGMYAELSLIWGAPGSAAATSQPAAPDADHSPAMWQGMAQAFRSDPNVILAPWGETTVDWPCFLNGCSGQAGYPTAGMQQAVNVMRGAGYQGPIAIPCIDYANVCADPANGGTGTGNGNWLSDHPSDPERQLIAEAHVYGKNTCDTVACFNTTMLPILQAGYPLLWGETGELRLLGLPQHLIHPDVADLGRTERRRHPGLDLGHLGRLQHRRAHQQLQRHPPRRLRHLHPKQLPDQLPSEPVIGGAV
jgi:hypothetical protein